MSTPIISPNSLSTNGRANRNASSDFVAKQLSLPLDLKLAIPISRGDVGSPYKAFRITIRHSLTESLAPSKTPGFHYCPFQSSLPLHHSYVLGAYRKALFTSIVTPLQSGCLATNAAERASLTSETQSIGRKMIAAASLQKRCFPVPDFLVSTTLPGSCTTATPSATHRSTSDTSTRSTARLTLVTSSQVGSFHLLNSLLASARLTVLV